MSKIDQDTRRKIHTILALSRSRGVDPVDILDRAGLLRYPTRELQDHIEFMGLVIEGAYQARVDDIVPVGARPPLTRTDAKNMLIRFLEGVRERIMRNGERNHD